MSVYNPPTEDMLFALTKIANIENFSKISGNNDISFDNIKLLIEEAGKFAKEKLDNINIEGDIKGIKLENFTEKPILNHYINAGIYVLSPSTIKKIPKNKFFNMTDLIEPLMKKGSVFSYPIYEYWLDIGKMEDFNKADNEYTKVFSK